MPYLNYLLASPAIATLLSGLALSCLALGVVKLAMSSEGTYFVIFGIMAGAATSQLAGVLWGAVMGSLMVSPAGLLSAPVILGVLLLVCLPMSWTMTYLTASAMFGSLILGMLLAYAVDGLSGHNQPLGVVVAAIVPVALGFSLFVCNQWEGYRQRIVHTRAA